MSGSPTAANTYATIDLKHHHNLSGLNEELSNFRFSFTWDHFISLYEIKFPISYFTFNKSLSS